MDRRATCFASPKVAPIVRHDAGGRGVIALAPLAANERIAVFGGRAIVGAEIERVPLSERRLLLQIDEDAYLLSETEGTADWFNHSCEPNAGMDGPIVLAAMRDIAAGEEICFDYAMTDGSDYDEFECACARPSCRGSITGRDWSIPALWDRYEGFFTPYLARRIAQLRATRAPLMRRSR